MLAKPILISSPLRVLNRPASFIAILVIPVFNIYFGRIAHPRKLMIILETSQNAVLWPHGEHYESLNVDGGLLRVFGYS